jgi:hypothetical protein
MPKPTLPIPTDRQDNYTHLLKGPHMKLIGILLMLVTVTLLSTPVLSDVPQVINYQGRLTDPVGQPVADDTYSIQFSIYADSAITMTPALWTETQNVSTTTGLFAVLLGSLNPINPSIFDGSIRYLGIKIGTNPESTPRTPIVSVPYAMVAGNTSGSLDCHDCDTVFINAVGPDELTAAGDTALTITNTGPDAHLGLQARVETSSDQPAAAIRGIINSTSVDASCYGAAFDAINTGRGTTKGIQAIGENVSPWYAGCGIQAIGRNNEVGPAVGGWFEASANGSGAHWGVYSSAFSASSAECAGIRTQGQNSGTGPAYGGYFLGYGNGGKTYGVYAKGDGGSDSTAYGVYALATNDQDGLSMGGYFEADSTGSSSRLFGSVGAAYGDNQQVTGVWANAKNNSTGSGAYGVGASVQNWSGSAYGGHFTAIAGGSSAVGIRAAGSYPIGVTGSYAYGVIGSVDYGGTASGGSYGGYFSSNMHGGPQYGIYANALYGVDQTQYGVYGIAEDGTGSLSAFGVYGRCERNGTGNGYGGYFLCDSTGTGNSYGSRTVASTKGSATSFGLASYAAAYGSGIAYGGFFEVPNQGTGAKYAVYGKSPSAGYAGYFDGDVRVSGDFSVIGGAKSAAVQTDGGDYRLVYCQESPESWFEDFGEGRLVNGRAHIELDRLYLQTVTIDAQNLMKVFIQLNDPDCNGTAVIRGTTGFDVVELQDGKGSASFSYRVVAKRRGFEQVRLERLPGMTPEEVTAQTEAVQDEMRAADRLSEEETARQKEYGARSVSGTETEAQPGLR